MRAISAASASMRRMAASAFARRTAASAGACLDRTSATCATIFWRSPDRARCGRRGRPRRLLVLGVAVVLIVVAIEGRTDAHVQELQPGRLGQRDDAHGRRQSAHDLGGERLEAFRHAHEDVGGVQRLGVGGFHRVRVRRSVPADEELGRAGLAHHGGDERMDGLDRDNHVERECRGGERPVQHESCGRSLGPAVATSSAPLLPSLSIVSPRLLPRRPCVVTL